MGAILAASLLSSAGTVAAAALLLAAPARVRERLVAWLLSYAVGALLGAAFLGLLPHAIEQAPAAPVLATALGGVVLFFSLEKLIRWRHRPGEDGDAVGAAGPLILLGDGLHNFVDGAVIAGAFLTGVPLGIATTVAVIAHELPQELGDFAILLDSGYSRGRAFALNGLSGLASLAGAGIAYFALEWVRGATPYILAGSAASFLYIAAADIVPSLQRRPGVGAGLAQLALILAGIATVAAVELGGPR